jgi:hypothetical protein
MDQDDMEPTLGPVGARGNTRHTNITSSDAANGTDLEVVLNNTIGVLRGTIEAKLLDRVDDSFVNGSHGEQKTRRLQPQIMEGVNGSAN